MGWVLRDTCNCICLGQTGPCSVPCPLCGPEQVTSLALGLRFLLYKQVRPEDANSLPGALGQRQRARAGRVSGPLALRGGLGEAGVKFWVCQFLASAPGATFLPWELKGVTAPHSQGSRQVNEVTQGNTQLRTRPTVTAQLVALFLSLPPWYMHFRAQGCGWGALLWARETEAKAAPERDGCGLLGVPGPPWALRHSGQFPWVGKALPVGVGRAGAETGSPRPGQSQAAPASREK